MTDVLSGHALTDVVAQMPAFLVVFGADRKVLWLNRVAFGYRPEDFLGLNADADIHPEDRPHWVHCMQCCLDLGETHAGTSRLLASGKTVAWRMAPFREGGAVAGCLVVSWDVTLLAGRPELVPAHFVLGPTCRAVVDLLRGGSPLTAKEIARGVGETAGDTTNPTARLRVLLADLEARGILSRAGGGYQIAHEFAPHLPPISRPSSKKSE